MDLPVVSARPGGPAQPAAHAPNSAPAPDSAPAPHSAPARHVGPVAATPTRPTSPRQAAARAAASRAAAPPYGVSDEADPDHDENIADAGAVGQAVVERLLGARVIEEYDE